MEGESQEVVMVKQTKVEGGATMKSRSSSLQVGAGMNEASKNFAASFKHPNLDLRSIPLRRVARGTLPSRPEVAALFHLGEARLAL
jgi:hypothetical protein